MRKLLKYFTFQMIATIIYDITPKKSQQTLSKRIKDSICLCADKKQKVFQTFFFRTILFSMEWAKGGLWLVKIYIEI